MRVRAVAVRPRERAARARARAARARAARAEAVRAEEVVIVVVTLGPPLRETT